MALTPIKVLLFLAGGTAAAGATAYVAGVFDTASGPVTVAAAPDAPPATAAPDAQPAEAAPPAAEQDPKIAALPPQEAPAAEPPAAAEAQTPPSAAAPAEAPPAKAEILAPSFDLVRVEADGSIVVAGRAAPGAKVELVIGSRVIGGATASPDGDFAVVIDEPLKPGDYQLVLRSTTPDNVVAMSAETAVVSIPETADGQVLALVEKPGEPAKLITVPEAPKPAPAVPPAAAAAAAPPATAGEKTAPPAEAAAAPAAEPEPAPAPVGEPKVAVEAVEIEGRKIFVAGVADPGRLVRAYANNILLGDAVTSQGGRFLIEAERDLPVGDYIIRVDALGPDGVKVVARAAVPFGREPGEHLAAVAPPAGQPAAAGAATAEGQPAPAVTEAAPPADAATPPAVAGSPAPAGEQPASADAPAATPPSVAEAPAQPEGSSPAVTAPAAPAEIAAAPGEEGAAELAPKLQAVDGAVIIRRGDTLWRISRRVYGHGVRYSTIYLANQAQISDPDRIWPGQVFKVPEKSDKGEPANLDAMGGQATTLTVQ